MFCIWIPFTERIFPVDICSSTSSPENGKKQLSLPFSDRVRATMGFFPPNILNMLTPHLNLRSKGKAMILIG